MNKDEYDSNIRPGLLEQANLFLNKNDIEASRSTLEQIKKLDEAFQKERLREQGKYLTFKHLFEDVVYRDLETPENEAVENASLNSAYLEFDGWLKSKGESIDNPDFLTKKKFLEFYYDPQKKSRLLIKEYEEEKQSWHLPQNSPANIAKFDHDSITSENRSEKLILHAIFNKTNNSYEVCLELFDLLELTIEGKPNPHIKKGRAGKLTGLIEAIKISPRMLNLDQPTRGVLLEYFNSFLNTRFKTFGTRSQDHRETLTFSKDYIKKYLKK